MIVGLCHSFFADVICVEVLAALGWVCTGRTVGILLPAVCPLRIAKEVIK